MTKDPYHPFNVEIIRSARRKRTLQARFVGENNIQVRVPDGMSPEYEEEQVKLLVEKLARKRTSTSVGGDADLMKRARYLNATYLNNRAQPVRIRWVSNQNQQWGSCTPATGDIRITDRLQHVPQYVLDSVIIHELTHTFVYGHGKDFWQWAKRAPKFERAQGYLEAYGRFGKSA